MPTVLIVIALGLIFVGIVAQIIRASRRHDPLLGGPPRGFGTAPASRQEDAPPRMPLATLPPEIALKARALLAAGRKVEAIKLVRDATRLGLRDAKDLVETLE